MKSSHYSVTRLATFAKGVDIDAFCEKVGSWVLMGPPGSSEEEWAYKTNSINAIRDGNDLIVVEGSYEIYPLRKAAVGPFAKTILIGRSESNDICIADLGISKLHARIFLEEDGLSIEDASSSNGTVLEAHVLDESERLEVTDGNYLTFGNRQFCFLSAPRLFGILRKFIGEPVDAD